MEAHSFGSWLRRKRKGRDLTQEELAQRVGCSTSNIRKIEAEDRRPSAQIALLLARQFEIPEAEQNSFLRFARGDWRAAPEERNRGFVRAGTGAAPRAKLPAPPNAIIGRQKELALVCGSLVNPATRLLTLVGPPGIGKTRLSLEAAHSLLEVFPDGVFFVPLAPLDNPDLVAPTITQTFGFADVKGQSVLERLKEGIGDKETLLVLDNAEHLIQESALVVTELLQACPALKVLVTSREALRVPGEWLFPVPVLAFPSEAQLAAAGAAFLSEFPALDLITERARALRPEFVLDLENAGPIAAICARLDGLPLAIELIAPRLRLMSPQTLLARMSDQFTLSADGQRAVPARQKTLNNAIAWSYDLLPDDEQCLLAQLAVFAGGFTPDAAEAAFAASAYPASVTDLIVSLSDKSLLQRSFDRGGEARFDMLATIRQFALQRLREAGKEQSARDRHLVHFARLAAKAEEEIHGPDQVEWLNRLHIEFDNFRAALESAISQQLTEVSLHLLGTVGYSWLLRGHLSELSSWFDRIRNLPDVSAHPAAYANLLTLAGRSKVALGDYSGARSDYEESMAAGLQLGVVGDQVVADAKSLLGQVQGPGGDNLDGGYALHEEALGLHEKCGDVRGMAVDMTRLGWLAYRRGQGDLALFWGERSVELFRQVGDLSGIAYGVSFCGLIFMEQGDLDRALLCFEEQLAFCEHLDDRLGRIYALQRLGHLNRYQANFDRAIEFYEASRAIALAYDLKVAHYEASNSLGIAALHRNDYTQARNHFERSYKLVRTLDEHDSAYFPLFTGMAAVAAGTARPERAAGLHGAARAFTNYNYYPPFDRAEFERHLSMARNQLGDAAFEAAAARGQVMSLDEAITCALE